MNPAPPKRINLQTFAAVVLVPLRAGGVDRLIDASEVELLTLVSRRERERRIKAGEFPAPLRLFDGGKRVVWRLSDVEQFIAERALVEGASHVD